MPTLNISLKGKVKAANSRRPTWIYKPEALYKNMISERDTYAKELAPHEIVNVQKIFPRLPF
jgi:hypothetical protein